MRFYLIVQSMHQLKEKYGEEAQTIKGNCENWVFLSSKEISLLSEISKLCGNVRATEESSREWPLISISQLQRLNKQRGEALIFYGRQYPFIAEFADIDECDFARYDPLPFTRLSNENVTSIGPDTLYELLMQKKRPMPFGGDKEEKTILDMFRQGDRDE